MSTTQIGFFSTLHESLKVPSTEERIKQIFPNSGCHDPSDCSVHMRISKRIIGHQIISPKKKTETSRGYRYSGTLIQTDESHHSESESIDRNSRGLTERFWRGNENGLSDRCLLAFSCLLSFIPRSNDAASN